MSRAEAVGSNRGPVEPVRLHSQTYDSEFAVGRERLVGICRALVGDDAEDVVQDVYLIGRSKLRQLQRPEFLTAWLTRIAVTECFQRHRRRQRLIRLLPRLLPPEAGTSDPDLRGLVERLPYRDRTIVVLHYGHGLSLEEIAELLELRPGTVRSLLFRTRSRLRRQLDQ